jgi:hypothetical protein
MHFRSPSAPPTLWSRKTNFVIHNTRHEGYTFSGPAALWHYQSQMETENNPVAKKIRAKTSRSMLE